MKRDGLRMCLVGPHVGACRFARRATVNGPSELGPCRESEATP